MALAHAIAEHLPYLRRYARALCGTQKSGDAYVRACLEAIVADTSVLEPGHVAAGRAVPAVSQALEHDATSMRAAAGARQRDGGGVEKRLEELTPAHRQALLLTAMEGFNVGDAAHILECRRRRGEARWSARRCAKSPTSRAPRC